MPFNSNIKKLLDLTSFSFSLACFLGGGSSLLLGLAISASSGLLISSGSDNIRRLVVNGLIIGLLLPLGRLGPLGVSPRASVAVLAATRALASTAKLLGKAFRGNLLQQVALVATAKDVDLLDSNGVQPALDDAPNGGEAPGSVDQVQLTQALRVVVLRNGRSLTDVRVDRGDLGQGDALEIHDGAAGLEQASGLARAGGQARVGKAFVLDGKVRKHALAGGDLVHGVQVNATKGLDVDGTAVLNSVSGTFFFTNVAV